MKIIYYRNFAYNLIKKGEQHMNKKVIKIVCITILFTLIFQVLIPMTMGIKVLAENDDAIIEIYTKEDFFNFIDDCDVSSFFTLEKTYSYYDSNNHCYSIDLVFDISVDDIENKDDRFNILSEVLEVIYNAKKYFAEKRCRSRFMYSFREIPRPSCFPGRKRSAVFRTRSS